jgi:SAM-dependent methyltransferase
VSAALSTIDRADWLACARGEEGEELRSTLASFNLTQLQRYPSPKTEGLPVGRELAVLRRFLTGGSCVLMGSVASGLYRLAASRRSKALFEAFVLNEPLSIRTWNALLGERTVSSWVEKRLLHAPAHQVLACRFQAIPIDGFVVLTDSIRGAQNLPAGANAISPVENGLNDHLLLRPMRRGGRALEVGPGAGLTTLLLARSHDHCDAVDINPRAVQATQFNARLNGVRNCRVHQRDIFQESSDLGRFDTIAWNTPFIFMPEQYKDSVVMAFGGEMGMEVTLRFLERLPALLKPQGVAYVWTASPIRANGENCLLSALEQRRRSLGQDLTYCHGRSFRGNPAHREFHRRWGIERFEFVVLEARMGGGQIRQVGLGVADAAVETLRRHFFKRGWG